MSGTYVAKPAVVVASVKPPGWTWPFPGPYPPGYTPVFSISASGPTITTVENNISISSILYDHGTYKTNEPDAGTSEVILTAFVDGSSRQLKFNGDESFSDVIYESLVDVGDDFWGTDSGIDVDIDLDDDSGKTLTFVVACVVEGQIFTDTVSIEIRHNTMISLPLMSAKATIKNPAMLSLVIDGPAGMQYNSYVSLTASLLGDDVTFEPSEGDRITWSAEIDGVPVDIRFLGDETYSETIESEYSELLGGDLGAEVDIECDIAVDQCGGDIVFTVSGTFGGEEISGDEVELIIVAPVYWDVQYISTCTPGTYHRIGAWGQDRSGPPVGHWETWIDIFGDKQDVWVVEETYDTWVFINDATPPVPASSYPRDAYVDMKIAATYSGVAGSPDEMHLTFITPWQVQEPYQIEFQQRSTVLTIPKSLTMIVTARLGATDGPILISGTYVNSYYNGQSVNFNFNEVSFGSMTVNVESL